MPGGNLFAMLYLRSALTLLMVLGSDLSRAEAPTDDLERTVLLMTKISSAYSPSFSADGKRIAFVSNINGSPQVWTVPTSGGWPELVTPFDDPVGSVKWSPEGTWLSFSLAPGGGMNQQVYLVHPDGSGLKRLTDGGKETNRLGVWSRNGRLLTLGSNRRTGSAIDAYVYGVDGGALKLVAENRGVGGFTDVTKDGRRALLSRTVARGDENLFLVELATGKETLLTPHTPPGSFSGAFSPNGNWVYLASNAERDRLAFAKLKLAGDGTPGRIEVLWGRDDAELETFSINEQGTLAALVWNVAGKSELTLYDLRSSKLVYTPKLPGERVGSVTFSKDGHLLAMNSFGAATPSDIWVLNLKTHALTQVTHASHAGVDPSRMVRPQLQHFKAHDGLELSGWLYLPSNGKPPFPTVLWFHGGPEGQERPGFSDVYQVLLARGIALFAPNVRGSTGFGKKFVDLDNGPLRFDGIRDIKSCVDYIVQQGVADGKHLGIMGGSYGGYMVMSGLTEYPDLFAAGADLFGVVNFETFFQHTEPWMAAISKTEYGDPDRDRDLLRRLSPIHKVDRVKAATLVVHGANDTNVPIVEAEQVVKSLQKRKIPVEYVLFPDEGHGVRKTNNRIRMTVAIVRWFEKYLTGKTDADTRKTEAAHSTSPL